MPIFVLTTHDNVLHVFASEAAALSSDAVKESKGGDHVSLFFADDGSGLRRELGGGLDYLRPWASCSSCSLSQVLHFVSEVRGASPLDTIEAITIYAGKPRS